MIVGTQKVHKNQEKAANAILNELQQALTETLLFTAQPQSGKTGAYLHALERFDKVCLEKSKRLHIFSVNPSDKQLLHQTLDRFMDSDVANNLIGGDVYHMPDLMQGRSPQLRTLLHKIKPERDILIIVWDEAHIGIQKSRTSESGLMVIPAFLKEVLMVLPGMQSQGHIKSVIISATPFSHNAFNAKLIEMGFSPIRELYMEPGKGYQSFENMIYAGRILSPVEYTNKNQKSIFKSGIKDILNKKQHRNSNKYLVFRFTVKHHISAMLELAQYMGIAAKVFNSASKNIKQFETTLMSSPGSGGPQILIIQQSYKQGKTLDLSNVGLWYEGRTSTGRTEADLIQSVGRCCGYNKFTFPIYARLDIVEAASELYHLCSINAFEEKNNLPMSDAATKFRRRRVTKNVSHCFTSEQEGKKYIISRGHNPKDIYIATCSKNASTDVARDAIESNIRQAGSGRQNLIYLDGPNQHYTDSWKEVQNQGYVGKWVWVQRERVVTKIEKKKDNSYFDVNVRKGNTFAVVK